MTELKSAAIRHAINPHSRVSGWLKAKVGAAGTDRTGAAGGAVPGNSIRSLSDSVKNGDNRTPLLADY